MYNYGTCAPAKECSFDFDLCGWTQDTTDDLDWIRNVNSTSSSGTGPSRDHTNAAVTGKYVYIEGSCMLKIITFIIVYHDNMNVN